MTLSKSSRALRLTAAAALLFAFGAMSALAEMETITLTTANSGLNTGSMGCCTGPYATVAVNRTSTTSATVTFMSLTNGGFTYLIGSQNGAAVNVNGTATVSGITGSNPYPGFLAAGLSDGGASQMDGFGNFNESIAFFDGFTHTVDTLQFTLTATGTTTWGSVGNVLTPNAGGSEVAIHGFSCKTPCNASEGATSTGFAAGTATVPEPTSLGLSGVLIGFLAIGGRMIRQRKPVV
jgi:hypothetical protein